MRIHLLFLLQFCGCLYSRETADVEPVERSASTDVRTNRRITVTSLNDIQVTAEGRLAFANEIPIADKLTNVMLASGSGGNPDDLFYCVADLTFEAPSGRQIGFDGCVQRNMAASFEFDPDSAPKIRTITMDFSSTTTVDYECAFSVNIEGVCGEGRYSVGASVSAQLTTLDCLGVMDREEGIWTASEGRVMLDRVEAVGTRDTIPSSSVPVRLAGTLTFGNIRGWKVTGPFELNQVLWGMDAEEVECLGDSHSTSHSSQRLDLESESDSVYKPGCSVSVVSRRGSMLPVLLGIFGVVFRRRRVDHGHGCSAPCR